MSFELAIEEIDRVTRILNKENIQYDADIGGYQEQIDANFLVVTRDQLQAGKDRNLAALAELQSARNLLEAAFDAKGDDDETVSVDSGT